MHNFPMSSMSNYRIDHSPKNSQQPLSRLSRRNVLGALVMGSIGITSIDAWQPGRAYSAPITFRGLDLSQIDPSIRPQDDLYRYVNGKWLDSFHVPADMGDFTAFSMLQEDNTNHLREIIESIFFWDDAESIKLKRLYDSIMDTNALDSGGLQKITRQWDLINSAQTKDDLAYIMGKLSTDFAYGPPIDFDMMPDIKNSSRYIMVQTPGNLGLDRHDLLDHDKAPYRAQYHHFLTQIATEAHMPNPSGIATTVLETEISLAKMLWDDAETRDQAIIYNVSSLKDLISEYPQFHWKSFLHGEQIPPHYMERILVTCPRYLTRFISLWVEMSLHELKSWLSLSALRQILDFLPKTFRDLNFHFYSYISYGIQQPEPRWKIAIENIDGLMGDALGKLYVKRFFPEQSKIYITQMVQATIAAYREKLAKSWLSPATKQAAIHKLDHITLKIGYPEHWQSYDKVTITHDYYENYLNLNKFHTQLSMERFLHPVDKTRWDATVPTVNAFYQQLSNSITIPAGILQAPFFDPLADPAVNFGAIGGIIGHEISHAFDDEGAQYDANGNLKSWWTPRDYQHFRSLTQHLAAQYDTFVPRGLPPADHIVSTNSVGEEAADLNGLIIAVETYSKYAQLNKLSDTHREAALQAFFFSFARINRQKWDSKYLLMGNLNEDHPPSEARVRQTVKNIDAFAYAFHTKPGDGEYLSPQQRIHFW